MELDRVVLVVPPAWNPVVPPLGIVAVASFARAAGISLEVVDWNPRFAAFLDRRFPGRGAAWERGLMASGRQLPELMNRLDLKPGVVRNVEPFGYEVIVGFNKSIIPAFLASSDNIHRDFLNEARPLRRFRQGRNLIGFSLVADSQLIATLTIVNRLKAMNPDNIVVMGGPFVTLHVEAFTKPDPVFAGVDYAIPFDGEQPFVALVRHLQHHHRGPVAGVIDRRRARPALHPRVTDPIAMDSLPVPDFRLLRRPLRSLVYETARGCPWGQCKFCYHIQYYGRRFLLKSPAKVVEDVAILLRRHPGASVFVADAYLSPPRFQAIAEAILQKGLEFDWWCMGKIQSGWNESRFRLGRSAGCRTIAWGLEHVNERLTRLIGKPIDRAMATAIFRACRGSGIVPEVQTLTGLPTETLDECRELLDYIDGMADTFASVPHMFGLAKKSPFHLHATDYGIAMPTDPDQDLAALFPWKHPDWDRMAALVEQHRPGLERRAERLRRELIS